MTIRFNVCKCIFIERNNFVFDELDSSKLEKNFFLSKEVNLCGPFGSFDTCIDIMTFYGICYMDIIKRTALFNRLKV